MDPDMTTMAVNLEYSIISEGGEIPVLGLKNDMVPVPPYALLVKSLVKWWLPYAPVNKIISLHQLTYNRNLK